MTEPNTTKDAPPMGATLPTKPIRRPKTDGPDRETALPVEGRPVVQTSLGPLDRDTVVNGRVGGVGTVSLQHDPEETPGGDQPMGPGPTALHDKSQDHNKK